MLVTDGFVEQVQYQGPNSAFTHFKHEISTGAEENKIQGWNLTAFLSILEHFDLLNELESFFPDDLSDLNLLVA